MIKVTIFKKNENAIGIYLSGHANYAESGKDIICSAVSLLVFTTINSIELYTDCGFKLDTNEDNAFIDFMLKDNATEDALLLMRSMVLGLQMLQDTYKNDYITLEFKEV